MTLYDPRNYGANPNDNIDDTKAIQAALDAAAKNGGGHVSLSAGTYILTGTGTASDGALRVYSNTELSGAGMGQTVLKLADGWSSKITGLIRTPVNQVTTDVIIRDITLDGNRHNSTADVDGIMTGVLPGKSEHDDRILIERVEIHDVSRIAFNPHEQTTNLIIRDSVAHHNSWDGFIADFVSNSIYENNVAYSNDRHGFNVVTHSHDVILRGNKAYDNGENGIVVQRGAGSKTVPGWQEMLNHDVLLEGNTVYGNGSNGILFKQAENSQVINNIIYDNAHDGIQLEGANNIVVDGNKILSSTIFGIEVRPYTGSLGGPGSSYDNTIINNVVQAVQKAFVESGSTTMNDSYANNLIGALGVSLVSTSKITSDSVSFVYDKISVTVTLPKNYSVPVHEVPTDTNPEIPPVVPEEPTPVTEPKPVPTPVPTPTPVDKGVFLSGDSANNTLNGTAHNDTLKGRSGNDTLYGGAGDDYLEGNDGDDILYGGRGKDTLKGSAGSDVFAFTSLSEAGEGDTVKDFTVLQDKIDIQNILKEFVGFTKGNAFTDGFVSLKQNGLNTDVYLDEDGLYGQAASKLLVSLLNTPTTAMNASNFIMPEVGKPFPVAVDPEANLTLAAQTVDGTRGHDTLQGGRGNDTLKGREGNDTLYGHSGNDTLWGNSGNDTLVGGKGSDRMKGGDGADLFVVNFNRGDHDMIEDLRLRDGDRLEITDILGFDPLSDAIADYVRFSASGKDTIVSVDVNGRDGGSNFFHVATLKGVSGVSAEQLYADGDLILSSAHVV